MTFREFNRTFPVYSKVQVFRLKQVIRVKDEVIPFSPEKVVECGSLTLDRYLDNIMEEYGRTEFEEILDKEVSGLSASGDTLNILIS